MNTEGAARSPQPIVAETPREQKDDGQMRGKKSRLKALMDRATREEQEYKEPQEKKARATDPKPTAKKRRASSTRKSLAKANALREQQLLIASLRQDNTELRNKLEASQNETRELKRLLEQQQEIAAQRNRALQGMIQRFEAYYRTQHMQQQVKSRDSSLRVMPNLAELVSSSNLSQASSRTAEALSRGQEAARNNNSRTSLEEIRRQLGMSDTSSTASSRVAASNQLSSYEELLASASQARSAVQLNASAQARIAERLNEIKGLQEELQKLTNQLNRR